MDGQFASKACVSVVVVKQENPQLKAHLVRIGLINNSSAAQWDHKSVNGTLKDDRGTAGASAVDRRRLRLGCHILCILSSHLLSNVHQSYLNGRRIQNKVVSCAKPAIGPGEALPEVDLSEVSMSYLLPGCQHDIKAILWSGGWGCREGGSDAGWWLFLVFTDSLGAPAGTD